MRSISIDYTVFRLVPSKQHLISTNSHEPMLDTKHFLFIFDVWPIVGTKNHTEHEPVSALRRHSSTVAFYTHVSVSVCRACNSCVLMSNFIMSC